MPQSATLYSPLSLKAIAGQQVSVQTANAKDLQFMKDILGDHTPEYNGYNTKLFREAKHSLKPETKCVYLPLLDMKPSDPDTICTAMNEAAKQTAKTDQMYTVFTTDLQLYKVTIDVLWSTPERFPNFISRLGGMHTLMNIAGCVGTLMTDSGLEEVLTAAFGGVSHMLRGKKFPQNIRALRMVAEEFLRNTIESNVGDIANYGQLL